MNETFSKGERLSSQKLIQQLFTTGSSTSASPVRARWLFSSLPAAVPVQIMIAVPKASFPKASDRNLIRRRIRESYRRNRSLLHESLATTGRQMIIAITYSGRKILPYSGIEEKIIVLLQRLKKENENASG
ncbi:MAG: ribonuclease P protein component [Bacteroidales bacterium]|nr:ribonuclease P protein component [Bacteroidales bacterium]